MEKIIKQYECGQELMADDLNDIISLGNDIILYIKDHESGWENNSNNGNNVQITPLNSSGQRIAKFKIDNNPEEYIYAPSNSVTPGLNGDTTIIEPLEFNYNKVPIANFVAGNGSNTLYAPAPGSGNNGQNGLDGLSTLFAFRGFANDSDAVNDWNNNFKNSRDYPPSGWSTSSNVSLQTGHMLYMTTAQRRGNNYIAVNDIIWQRPVRIGSDGSTSTTGTDDDNYNYIYCRTTTNVAPGLTGVVEQSSYGVHLLELIEADTVKGHGYKPVNDNSIDIATATISDISGAWTDHPYGVSADLPFEWQTGFKKNETTDNWEYYFGPVIVSHYGYDGLDGDGLEYIFYLLAKNLAGIPSLGAPYEGRIGENGTTTLTNVSVNSTNYQLDDFIPTGWHDNPQTISEEYPRQYVSTRKKNGSQEVNNLWQAFSTPRLWNVYATNGFLATLDNDSIILDDDNGSEAIEFVSLTKVFLWDGANDVTLSNNYSKVTVEINCIGFANELLPALVTSTANNNVLISSNSNEVGWEKEIEINKNAYYGFALTKTTSGNPKLSTGTGSITYTIRAYKSVNNNDTLEIEASRVQTIQVIDINNGVAYLLLVTPNTLGVERTDDSSPYVLRSGNSSIVVTATAATETSVEGIEIKNGSSNASDGDLYVVVSNSGGIALGINPTVSNDNKTLTYDLSSLLNLVTTIAYVTVDLYYMYNNTGIKVDSETVDFSIKGDKGPAGQGSGTESYVVTTLNDNAVIDDLTVAEYALREATLYTLTVYKGSTNVTNNCRFVPDNVTLPTVSNSQQLILGIRSSNQTEYLDPTDYNLNNVNTFVLYAANGVTNITPGSYYYDINIYHDIDANNSELVATKRFKLYVDANVSSDGSFYKLCMENDVVYYIYDGTALSEGYVIMTPRKIKANSSQQQSIYKIVQNINDEQNIDSSKLYLEVGNLYSICSINNNGLALISRAHISYNVDGYDGITLYKGNLYVDGPERIECIKYGSPGSPGGTGEDAYTITSNNDNSILDDLILSNSALASVTTQTFTVYKGSLDITSSCSYQVTNINLNSSDLKVLSYSSGSWSDATNSSVLGMNLFRIQLVPTPDPVYTEITKGEYYYDVVITHGSYSATKRHKITVKDISFGGGVGALYNLNFEPDGVMYNEDGEVLSTTNSVITVYDRNTEQSYQPVETLPESSIDSTRYYVVLGPLYSRIVRLQLEQDYDSSYEWEGNTRIKFKKYEINRATVPYVAGGYPVLLYKGSELIDGPEIFSCIKVKRDTSIYNLETYPTSLKFNVASDGATLIPSELVARCKISKKVGNNDYTFSNNNIDGYYIYYNITNASGLLVNLSGAPTGSYVIYNNDDIAIAGIHIPNSSLNYTSVNFYLAKYAADMQTTSGDLSYTTSLTPIKQVSVPILRDGLKGDSSSIGQTGRFYYFAGDWEGDVTSLGLKVTNYSYPYTYYLGSYYMYVGDPSSTSPYMITKADLLGTNISDITMSDNWEEMTYNKFVVSEAMFANYAKLGAAIFNRDWMISQYGSIGGTPSTNYISFNPVEFMNAIKGYAEIGVVFGGGLAPYEESGSSYNILSQLFKLPLNNYTITVTLSGSSNSGKSVRLVKFNELNLFKDISKVSIITSGNSANASTETSGTCSNGTTITLNALTSGDYVYCLLANNSSDVSVTNIKVEITGSYTAFIPNFALDLRSGLTYLNNAYIKGLVSTVNDLVVIKEESQNLGTWATISDRGLFCRNDTDTPSPSLNEVLASIKVHKYTDTYGYTSLSGEVELRRRLNGSSNWHYASLTGSGLTFAYHEGNDIPNLTEISALRVHTATVQTPIVYGGGTFGVEGSMIPTALPGNIITGSGTKSLPSNPIKGMIIFAKGTDGDMTIDGNGKNIMAANSASLDTSISIGRTSWIFMYDGTQWIRFSGKE